MKISVVTVVLNRAETIRTTIESVINQTYKNIEYIVIDGGSTDGTLDIINSYQNKIDIIISEKDNGIYDAMNKGLEIASGDIIGFLNSDDYYANSLVLEKIAGKFINDNNDILYGDVVFINKNNKLVRYWKAGEFKMDKIKFGWMPPHTTFYVKRNLYRQCGGFDSSYGISADYELEIRLLRKFNVVVSYIPEVIVTMRTGGKSNRNLKSAIHRSLEDYRVIKQHKIGGIFTLMIKSLSKIPQFFKSGESIDKF